MAVIDLDLIASVRLEIPPNQSEPSMLEASDVQKSFLKQWNAGG